MLTVILPLLSFFLSFFSRYLGRFMSSTFIIGSIILAFIHTCFLAKLVFVNHITFIYTFSWITLNTLDLNFTFLFDPLSVTMSLLITFITSLVMIYSYSYFGEDPALVRFLAYLAFFCACMLTLVTSGNYVQLFVGWEGVGLASYLLISFWTTRTEANQGALKAVLLNRIGDVFFMFALALLWVLFKSFDFGVIFMLFPDFIENQTITFLGYRTNFATILTLCLFLAACAKSAQLLLHTWLPDAMEGPTPVSSLLHSATMVTAGVFLIIRSSYIFSFTPNLSYTMACIGILTALVSGLIGITQYDLKRIIAYSTASQLGFMVFACGLGYYTYALFHLVTHAFFKCLLFLCSGAILHALRDEQDIRRMGGLMSFMPVTFCTMFIGTLALTGFPMLAGYYSKDLLLETALDSSIFGTFIFIVASIAAFLTAAYSIRSLYFVFWRSTFPATKHLVPFIEDAPPLMAFSMIVLTIGALFSGFLLLDICTGPTGLLFWKCSMHVPVSALIVEHEFESLSLKLLPTFAGFLGTILGLLLYSSSNFFVHYLRAYSGYNLAIQKFYFDQLYILIFGRFSTSFGYTQYKLLDRGILEFFGPSGLTFLVKFFMSRFTSLHTGYLLHNLLYVISALIIILFDFNLPFGCWMTIILILVHAEYRRKFFKNVKK